MFDIKEELKKVPSDPGVYIMKDKIGTTIYVGKAKNLKNRLKQYFQATVKHPKVQAMVDNVEEFEYIIVQNEVESLILEQNLIKDNMPKYNILLKDDKQYPYIKINIKDRFPKIVKTRTLRDDGSIYFGPYTSAISVNEVIEFFNRHFKIRTCGLNLNDPKKVYRPCLNYYINKCDGPCMGNLDSEVYKERIKKAIAFFDGKDLSVIKEVEEMMSEAAAKLDFENASYYRNLLLFLNNLQEKQNVDTISFIDKDVIAMARGVDEVCIQVFFVRGGKILGREHYILSDTLNSETSDILSAFLKQFYAGYNQLPNEIFIEEEIDDMEIIEGYLSQIKNRPVRILVPKRGENVELLALVRKNAEDMLSKYGDRFLKKARENMETLGELKNLLGLKNLPLRIEAYDISHIAGDESVGSMVVFEKGQSKKTDYRKFKIKTVDKNDDYASLREVLERRFRRRENSSKNESFKALPDLIMMDGGKGQVNVALDALKSIDLDIPICGLVKNDFHQTRGIIYDNVEYEIPITSNLYRMMYKIQEEAHRFAINYHRARMSNRFYRSELDEIPGIGEKRKAALIDHFKSIEKIRDASIEQLTEVKGMNKTSAKAVYEHFREE